MKNDNKHTEIKAQEVFIRGLVQGVGFRPFIHRMAIKYGLAGSVENRNDGVYIKIQGNQNSLDHFIRSVKTMAPPASDIEDIIIHPSQVDDLTVFRIISSRNVSEDITEVSPDIAVCNECLDDMKKQPHRINYPFINCTHCGPRFSIIRDLPYDRDKTTMKEFIMCAQCRNEYTDIDDRRFHAQPVACNYCGPVYELILNDKVIYNFSVILKTIRELISAGKIIAVKGTGGFHLMCDATSEEAVGNLRNRKRREGKPFAVMFSDLRSSEDFVFLHKSEKKELQSWRRPVVLLKKKKDLAPSVTMGLQTIGVILPYMPFHYLLFEGWDKKAVVLTSGNVSDEPIVIDNETAVKELGQIADAVLVYNRDIFNRTDDSVITVINDSARVIRRSRGFVPGPVRVGMNVNGILAAGAELVNCFCIGKGNQAILSQHIGDLKNMETLEFYRNSITQFMKLFRFHPVVVAHDLHPDYLSTCFAESLSCKKIPVQHHHAHIASCMAEHRLDEKVIGVSFDGTGLGDDHTVWGGEFFLCELSGYQRFSHFENIPMPGGDKATEQPWRMGLSYLYHVFGEDLTRLEIPFLQSVSPEETEHILLAVKNNINCPLTSSAGRLFDAVSAITGLCSRTLFHAEAPMRLESILNDSCRKEYDFQTGSQISFRQTIRQLVDDLIKRIPLPIISAKFHNTVISVILATVTDIRNKHQINKVVLSGGVFQNRYISEHSEKRLKDHGFEVFPHRNIPCNDGGIALGQLVIASKTKY